MFTYSEIQHITGIANDLFVQTLFPTRVTEDNRHVPIVIDEDILNDIVELISDASLTYLSTWETLAKQWLDLRDRENSGTIDWLIQTTTTWRILAFTGTEQYEKWVDKVADSYGAYSAMSAHMDLKVSYHPDYPKEAQRDKVVEFIASDDDVVDRLAVRAEYHALLTANPWLVYLTTLQTQYHKFYEMLVSRNQAALK